MKRVYRIVWLLLLVFSSQMACGQAQDIEQLLLDVEKLTQLKAILKDLQQGYQILNKGYETIKTISHGNFDLHSEFLSALLQVSPAVHNDPRSQSIPAMVSAIYRQCHTSEKILGHSTEMTTGESRYFLSVFRKIQEQNQKTIAHFIDLLSPGVYRMSDEERLSGLETIFQEVTDQLTIAKKMNHDLSMLMLQRACERKELIEVNQLYSIK